jgi:hypothetical protein
MPELEICPICKLSIKPDDQVVTLPPATRCSAEIWRANL